MQQRTRAGLVNQVTERPSRTTAEIVPLIATTAQSGRSPPTLFRVLASLASPGKCSRTRSNRWLKTQERSDLTLLIETEPGCWQAQYAPSLAAQVVEA